MEGSVLPGLSASPSEAHLTHGLDGTGWGQPTSHHGQAQASGGS